MSPAPMAEDDWAPRSRYRDQLCGAKRQGPFMHLSSEGRNCDGIDARAKAAAVLLLISAS